VDLLLNPTDSMLSTVMKTIIPTPERLAAAQKMFRLLDQIPVVDPPADLIARTLELIDSNPIPPPSAMPPPQTIDPSASNNPPTSS